MSKLRERLEKMAESVKIAEESELIEEQIDEAAEKTEKVIKQKGLAIQAEINKEKYIKLVEKVQNSMLELSEAWEADEDFDEVDRFLSISYPFQNSFDEVCHSVMNWLEVIKTQ